MRTLLLVDDDHSFLTSLAEGLTEPDRRILKASNGKDAVQTLESDPVDLVITDLQMPEMGGFELVAYLGRNHPRLPIVVMTAFGTAEMESNFRMLGVDHFLEKPIDLERLLVVVDNALYGPTSPEGTSPLGASAENQLKALREAEESELDGEVVVRHGQESGRVFFHEGCVAWVVATSYRQTLMGHLVLRTEVTPDELKVVFEECKRTRKNFGETIIEWGLIDRDTLRELLLEHISKGFAELLTWPSSEVMFVPEHRSFSSSLLYRLDEVLNKAVQFLRDTRSRANAETETAEEPEATAPTASDAPPVATSVPIQPPNDEPAHRSAAINTLKGEIDMSDLESKIAALKDVNGFIGAGAFTSAGELLAQVSAAGVGLDELGALANDVLLKSQQTSDIMGVGRGNQIHITAPKANILVRCLNENTDFAANEPGRAHVHMMLILEPEGNIALGKMRLEKVIQEVAPLLR